MSGTIAWAVAFWHRHAHATARPWLQWPRSQLIANHAIVLMFIPFILSSNLREEYSRAKRK
jgi:hypothetical protein